MGRYVGAKCRFCRREGKKLHLKGSRCYTDACAFERRPYPPGHHGPGRMAKFTEYGIQLREKQRVKRVYGLSEQQFRIFFKRASNKQGNTGENLLTLLERRLDSVVYKMGFALTIQQARQLITHGHFRLNSKKVNIPSIIVKKGDVISVKEKSKEMISITEALEASSKNESPRWLTIEHAKHNAVVNDLPIRADIDQDIEERLIVELYSK